MTQQYRIFTTALLSLGALLLLTCGEGSTGAGFDDPNCSISLTELDFGEVLIGESASANFQITNTGFGTLNGTVTSNCPEITVSDANYSLTNSRVQTVNVQFAPSATGAFVCTLSTGGNCAGVVLTGIGVNTCCIVTPTALDFGSLATGSQGEQIVALKNCGQATITGDAQLSVCDDYTIISGGGGFTLTPGASHTVTIRLDADNAGEPTCTLDFGATACGTVDCRADVGLFDCFVEPNRFEFDSLLVGEVFDSVFVIRNQGTVPLIGRIFPGCDDFTLIPPENDIYHLAPEEVLEVRFRFSPLSRGDKICFFRLTTKRGDDGEKPCSDVVVVGRGYEEDEGP